MADSKIEKITCAACGKEFDFEVWGSINVTNNPELKEKVMTGEIYRSQCPECGDSALVYYSHLYNDMKKGYLIAHASDDKDYDMYFEAFSGNGSMSPMIKTFKTMNYILRIVSSLDELKEKILIFDNDLDDRVIELAKRILGSYAVQNGIDVKYMYFYIDDDGNYGLAVFDDEKYVTSLRLPNELYAKLQADFLSDAPSIRADRFDIDTKWAHELLTGGQS